MKKTLRLSLTALVIFASFSFYAQKTDIKLNLKKGDVYMMKTQMSNVIDQDMMGMKIKVDQDVTTETEIKVADVLANGNYIIEQTYKRLTLSMNTNGQKLSFDTDVEDASSPLALLKKLKDATIKYELTPKGDISNVSGLNELITGMDPRQANMVSGIVDKDKMAGTFNYIPKEKVNPGDTFIKKIKLKEVMGIAVDTRYTVEKITSDEAAIRLASDMKFSPAKPIVQNGISMKMDGTGMQKGIYLIDMKTGMPKSAKTTQDIDMTVNMKNPQTGEDMAIPMKIASTVDLTVTKM
jgi:hypothetical protein